MTEMFGQALGSVRIALVVLLCMGMMILDSVSRIISMCVDGFLAVVLIAVIWPAIKPRRQENKS